VIWCDTREHSRLGIDQLTLDCSDCAGGWRTAARAETAMSTRSLSRHDSFQMDSPAVSLRPHSPPVASPVQRIADALAKCQTIMKESPLTVIGLRTKRSPKISEIIQQTKVLCEVGAPQSYYFVFTTVCHTGYLAHIFTYTILNSSTMQGGCCTFNRTILRHSSVFEPFACHRPQNGGGFRHVQHVRPNRGPHTNGAPHA